MTELHKTAFPQTKDAQTVQVKIQRLDDIAKTLEMTQPLMLKIDVQGFEDRILRGGEQTVARADVILIETSLEKLYEGQPLFDEIYNYLVKCGFTYAGSFDQLHHPQSGVILQQDSIFVRR